MKHSKLVRVAALVAATSLIASCGGGSESSDSTERTRNASISWSETRTPTKMLVYGTQDGHIEVVRVGSDATEAPTSLGYVEPGTSWRNAIVSIAVDTSRSELIFSGTDKSNNVYLSKMNLNDSTVQSIFSSPNGLVDGMGYDPATRIAVLQYSNSGTGQFLAQSVDESGSPLIAKTSAGYALPAFDGNDLYIANTEVIGLADSLDYTRLIQSSVSVGTPRDISSLAQDTQTAKFYGGRNTQNQLLLFDVKGSGNDKIETISQPSALAVFSDGVVAVGTGNSPRIDAPTSGALSLVDPSGATSSPLFITNFGMGSTSAGVQSLWAVESPISTAAPTLSTDSAGNLVCSDASWRGDLPLSRLSRAPIASARSYGWFFNGTELVDESSETLVVEETGSYACAVIAANVAGVGNSALSNTLKVEASEIATTSTTSSSSTTSSTIAVDGTDSTVATTTTTVSAIPGGSESSDGPSPVVTVPTVSPGTPIAVTTPSLRSAKWTFKGRTAKVTFRKWSGASKYRLVITGATKKTIRCKSSKTTVTCTTTTLKRGLNAFSAKAISKSNITLALSTKAKLTK
jgi:hypothetical protein